MIEEFKKFLCLNFNNYFDIPYNYYNQLENDQIINYNNIECDGNTFKLNIDFDLKLKKCFIDDIELISYNVLIRTPPFSYYIKDNKFIIQIEYCGKLEHYTIKKYISNGQYKFNIIGKTKIESDFKIFFSNINEGDFIISFDVSLDYIVIKSNEYMLENDEKNGILNIIYEIGQIKNNYDEDRFIDDDDL